MTRNCRFILLAALLLLVVGTRARFAISNPQSEISNHNSEISFPTQILPLLTKAGCNAGACHGAATGQAGFKLSLLGYDPQSDYASITRELTGRRIDLATPVQSLILQKATRTLPHKGGLRIEENSADYRAIINWLDAGAPYGPPTLQIEKIEVEPATALLNQPGDSLQLKVTATFSDNTTQDVTTHALYSPNDDSIARAGETGQITVTRRGLTAIMVRYGGKVAAVRIAAPFRDAQIPANFLPIQNFIDEKVLAELQRLHIPPSPISTDSQFIRRAFLDITGTLPTSQEIHTFLKDTSPQKRANLIANLFNRDEFTDLWTLRLADLLLIDSKRLGVPFAQSYHHWLRNQISQNKPIDRMVSDLLTTTGELHQNAPANFHRLTTDPRDMSEYVSSALLGIQIACARCHTHPFAAWTQNDYYSFAAYFARTKQEGNRIVISNQGEIQHPKTHKDTQPKPLGEPAPQNLSENRLTDLAAWTTSPNNPYFAKAFVNRIWKQMIGRGIVEPVNDLRITNPPSNPALLDALAADFIAHQYDLRHLIKTIANSSTYQLSSATNEDNRADDRLFSHAYAKPLSAQVLADAIAQASAIPDTYPEYPQGTRAVQLIDARQPSPALDVLGRCSRDTNCETQPRTGGVSQALHLINGSTINQKLKGGIIDQLIKENRTDEEIIESLYLRTLSRLPTEKEKSYCTESFAKSNPKRDAIEDLLWALLNSKEFVYNH